VGNFLGYSLQTRHFYRKNTIADAPQSKLMESKKSVVGMCLVRKSHGSTLDG
jgi:hypothetical protein